MKNSPGFLVSRSWICKRKSNPIISNQLAWQRISFSIWQIVVLILSDYSSNYRFFFFAIILTYKATNTKEKKAQHSSVLHEQWWDQHNVNTPYPDRISSSFRPVCWGGDTSTSSMTNTRNNYCHHLIVIHLVNENKGFPNNNVQKPTFLNNSTKTWTTAKTLN